MNISMNPNGELYQSAVNAPGTIEIPESFLNEARPVPGIEYALHMCDPGSEDEIRGIER